VPRVPNLVQALEGLKKAGVWVVGTVVNGGMTPWAADLAGPTCLVLGAEDAGLRPLLAKTCDFLVSLPMKGHVASLNVAAVAAVLCYEAVRQRRLQGPVGSEEKTQRGIDFRAPRT